MKLKSLKLENFRNYGVLNLDLSDGVTIFLGENAQGKTNLLESIAFLALGKSFRAGNFMEVLGWERPHGRIKGTLEQDGKEKLLEVFFEREPRRKKIKKQTISTHSMFQGIFWNTNPNFSDFTKNDFHFATSSVLNGNADSFYFLPKDIEETMRDVTNPDIGCYEVL